MRFFSTKTLFEVMATIWANLTSAWFGILMVSPALFEIPFNQFLRSLTINLPLGILGLLITLWFAQKSKSLKEKKQK